MKDRNLAVPRTRNQVDPCDCVVQSAGPRASVPSSAQVPAALHDTCVMVNAPAGTGIDPQYGPEGSNRSKSGPPWFETPAAAHHCGVGHEMLVRSCEEYCAEGSRQVAPPSRLSIMPPTPAAVPPTTTQRFVSGHCDCWGEKCEVAT